MPRWGRFLCFLAPAAVIRFLLGEHTFSFVWFILLYFPSVNWIVYWTLGLIRLLVNRIAGREVWTIARIRALFGWYIFVPGALVVSDLLYRGYLFNR